MNSNCDATAGSAFKSRSQQVRVVTEGWFGSQGYCLSCNSDALDTSKPNSKAKDFSCPICGQVYELKSSSKLQSKTVVDGAYATMLRRIRDRDAPALVLLRYLRGSDASAAAWMIDCVTAIHPVFLTDAVVVARTPLSATARRAGWQGCNLRIDRIPPEGRITIVDGGNAVDRTRTRALYESSKRLYSIDSTARGWTATVLRIVRDIGQATFELGNVYARQKVLQDAFPNNHHVEAKIRQQLQVLRDLGYLRFLSRGVYEVIS